MTPRGILLAAAAAFSILGCGDDAPASTPADAGRDAGPWPHRDAGDATATDAGPANITLDDRPGASAGCATASSCTADYLAFPARAAAHARPATDADIQAALDAIARRAVPLVTDPIGDDALRDAILDGANARFLFDGLHERALRVSVTSRRATPSYEETSLLFEDEWVGTFEAVLLTPLPTSGGGPTPTPLRALVALHGHGDSAAVYRDDYHGDEWPARGYAILIPTLRAMNIDDDEHETTRTLLHSGLHLIMLRAYEAALARKYLASRADVDASRIGLIGHSGGSSTASLLVRIADGFAALVVDHSVDWFLSGFEAYHCETAPPLHPYHRLVGDLTTAPIPALRVPYGYTDGMAPIFTFLDERLAASTR